MIPSKNTLTTSPLSIFSTWDKSKLHQQLMDLVPKVLKPSLALVPFAWQQKTLLPILHKVFAEALAEQAFDCLQGKWLKLSVLDLDMHWLFSLSDNQFIMKPANNSVEADVSFSANGNDLLLIAARHEDPDTLFFQRRLLIEGNTALGLEIKNLIDGIDTSELPELFNQALQFTAKCLIIK